MNLFVFDLKKIPVFLFLLIFVACNNESITPTDEQLDLSVDCINRWEAANDTIVMTESELFQDFSSPIDSIENLIKIENIKPKEYDFNEDHRAHYYRNKELIKLVFSGIFETKFTNEFYIIDHCHLMIRKTKYWYDYPDSVEQIYTFALNRDSICRAFVNSPRQNYLYQDDITGMAQKKFFEHLKNIFENELRLTEPFWVK